MNYMQLTTGVRSNNRIRYFDIAKGIAILAVILGHSVLISNVFLPDTIAGDVIYHVCFTFHMPLFFILSGYFMHPERDFRWRKESRELIATYAITASVIIFINTLSSLVLGGGLRATFKGWFAAAFYGAGDFGNYAWPVPFRIGALWFLLGLFWAHLFVHFSFKYKSPSLVIAILFVVGYLSSRVLWLPLSVQAGMTASAFVYCGVLARRYEVLRYLNQRWWIVVPFALLWVVAIVEFTGFSMAMNQYGFGFHFILSVIGAIAGTVCVLGISMLLDRYANRMSTCLALFGKNSLALLCVHIIEDDCTPWQILLPSAAHMISPRFMWAIVFLVRVILDVVLARIVFAIPHVNKLFFPYLEKKAPSISGDMRAL